MNNSNHGNFSQIFIRFECCEKYLENEMSNQIGIQNVKSQGICQQFEVDFVQNNCIMLICRLHVLNYSSMHHECEFFPYNGPCHIVK